MQDRANTTPCKVCPRRCAPAEGALGFCRARVAKGGAVVPAAYAYISGMALDPIEKKPLARFFPGSNILSVGGFGCNMRCPFCQNYGISQSKVHGNKRNATHLPPEQLAKMADELRAQNNIGVAFTYNEPAVQYEYVRDAARLVKARGLHCVMVTNGYFTPFVLHGLDGLIDAFNIDLKCFTEEGYRRLGGNLQAVQATIAAAAKRAHVEVTTLVVPGLSDGEADMRRQAAWLAQADPEIALHVTRYFPHWQAKDPPTPPEQVRRLAAVAKEYLEYVYVGNCG